MFTWFWIVWQLTPKMDRLIADVTTKDIAAARAAHAEWWQSFWDRSWIYVAATDPAHEASAFLVTRGYILQRYMNAHVERRLVEVADIEMRFGRSREDDAEPVPPQVRLCSVLCMEAAKKGEELIVMGDVE